MACSLGLRNRITFSNDCKLTKLRRVKVADEVKGTNKALKIPFDVSFSGKVLDYMGRDVEKIEEKVTAEEYKELFTKHAPINPFKKQVPYGQVFTGNIAIDFTDPIPVGSFAYFKGNSNTGTLWDFLDH